MKVLMISADNFEDSELLVPYYRMLEEGHEVDITSIKKGKIRGKKGYDVEANKNVSEIDPEDYGLLILPGGKAPGEIRKDPEALEIVTEFFENNKPVAAICHGPQVLISAGVMKGRHATCYRSVAKELKAAKAKYEDKEVIVDKNLITSRQPSDLPAFMREIMRKVGEK
jgi:protease I